MLLKQGNMPDRPLCWGPITCPSSLFRHSGLLSNSEARRMQGIWTFCNGGDLSASGHVTLLLLALKTKCKLIPCSSWAMEAPWGAAHCSSIRFLQLRLWEAGVVLELHWAAVLALGLCALSFPCVCLLRGA